VLTSQVRGLPWLQETNIIIIIIIIINIIIIIITSIHDIYDTDALFFKT